MGAHDHFGSGEGESLSFPVEPAGRQGRRPYGPTFNRSTRPVVKHIAILCLSLLTSGYLLAQVLPAPSTVWLNTCMPTTTTTITVCASGCDYTNAQLQHAFNKRATLDHDPIGKRAHLHRAVHAP